MPCWATPPGATARWHDFAVAVDEYAARTASPDRIVAAANDCLHQIHAWLSG